MSANVPQFRLTVADSIELRGDGKLTATGYFPDSVVILFVPPEKLDEPVPLENLAFLATITNLPEEKNSFQVSAELISVDGKVTKLGAPVVLRHPGPGRSMNLLFNVAQITFRGSGRRALRVHLDDRHYDLPYDVKVERDTQGFISVEPSGSRSKSASKTSKKKVATKKASSSK